MIPQFSNSVRGGPPEPITALTPAAWYRYGVGITVTGQGVSAWADQSGNGNNILQGTDANRALLQADNSILFDGVSDFLQDAFTLDQPFSRYLLFKQVTWTSDDFIVDGVAASALLVQSGLTPALVMNAGNAGGSLTAIAVNTYGVDCQVFNGASSVHQQNTTTSGAFDAGAGNPGGITLGTNLAGSAYGHIQVKEVILFAAAHDAATRTAVITYLATVGGL